MPSVLRHGFQGKETISYYPLLVGKLWTCIPLKTTYCNTVLLEAIENFILANKRYVLHLYTAILYSWRLLNISY